MRKVIDAILLLVVLCGAFLAWQTGQERSRLTRRYNQLAQVAGDLPIGDPAKFYAKPLETGEPLHFAWRMYTPPNYRLATSTGSGSSTSWSSQEREFIGRVRLRETPAGMLEVYAHFAGGSSSMSVGGPALAKLLHGRWDKVQVEQLGSGGMAVLDPTQGAVLLKLRLPDELMDEAKTTLSTYEQQQLVPAFVEVTLGPRPTKP